MSVCISIYLLILVHIWAHAWSHVWRPCHANFDVRSFHSNGKEWLVALLWNVAFCVCCWPVSLCSFVVGFAVLVLSVALLHYTMWQCNLLKHIGKSSALLPWHSTSRASCVYGAFCTLLHVDVCYWALLHGVAFHSRACHERLTVLVCLIIHCQL